MSKSETIEVEMKDSYLEGNVLLNKGDILNLPKDLANKLIKEKKAVSYKEVAKNLKELENDG